MVLDDLERLAVAVVAITAAALGQTSDGELTFLGWRTLVVLGASERPMRTSDLGARLGLSRPSVSKLVGRLERRGLLDLSADPADGRVQLVSMSEKGRALRASVIARRRELFAQVLGDPLPPDFATGLAAVADRLDRWS